MTVSLATLSLSAVELVLEQAQSPSKAAKVSESKHLEKVKEYKLMDQLSKRG
jgi:hypothetical protein